MGFKCGIVGLPNVGKSTLFNALTETAAAQAANYPFCTIEPNVGEVAVPDSRLDKLSAVPQPPRAGGAFAFGGRCLENPTTPLAGGKIAPLADIETIETELMLADLDS